MTLTTLRAAPATVANCSLAEPFCPRAINAFPPRAITMVFTEIRKSYAAASLKPFKE
jgi:hypothetical protein